MSKFTSLSASPLALRRTIYVAVIGLCIAIALTLISATDRSDLRARDAAIQSSWQSNAAPSPTQTSVEAVYRRFNIKAAVANTELTWQASSSNELRASFRALVASHIKIVQAKITRNGSNFLVNAERAP